MQAISVSPVLVVIAIAVIVLLAAVCIYLYTTTRIRSLYGNIAIVALAGPGGLVLVTEWLELDFNETSIGFPAAAVAIVALICLTKIELTQSADPNLSLLKQQFDSTDSVADLSEFDPVLLLQQCQNNWEQFDLQCIKEIEVDEEDRDACHSICRMILNGLEDKDLDAWQGKAKFSQSAQKLGRLTGAVVKQLETVHTRRLNLLRRGMESLLKLVDDASKRTFT